MELSQRRKTKRSAFRSYRLSFPLIGFGKSLEKLNQHRFFLCDWQQIRPEGKRVERVVRFCHIVSCRHLHAGTVSHQSEYTWICDPSPTSTMMSGSCNVAERLPNRRVAAIQ